MHKRMKLGDSRRFPRWLWLPILIGSFVAWSLPFISERHDESWRHFRGERALLPLTYTERLYQFNVDQEEWIKITKAFPGYYSLSNYRINRPGYPAILSLSCRMQQGIYGAVTQFKLQGFSTPCSEPLIIFTALAVNWLLFVGSVYGFYHLLIFWKASEFVASIAAAQLALSPFTGWTLLTVATDFVMFPIIIAILWLFSVMIEQDKIHQDEQRSASQISSYALEFAAGFLIGVLMLVKSQYDIVMTIWLFLFALHHFRALILSFVGHIVPLIIWLGIVRLSGWEYYNPEFTLYRQGVWIWEEFINWSFQNQLSYLQEHLAAYLSYFVRAFGWVSLALAALGIVISIRQQRIQPILVAIPALLINSAFVFAIQRYYSVYVSETFFFVYPLAALGIASLMVYVPPKYQKWTVAACLLAAAVVAWPLFWLDAFSIHL